MTTVAQKLCPLCTFEAPTVTIVLRLFAQTIDRVQAGVRAKLAELGLDPDAVEGLDDIFKNVTDPFEGIETCHLQE